MTARAFYNENDPAAAAWLRELIKEGHIAPGDVDERDIRDLRPSDLAGYTQCHFFAGIGAWSYALRLAGVPDSRPLWTGSCPCQPFSSSGKGEGFDDERHLWPFWHHLIRMLRPGLVFGEQVASKDGLAWLDLVYADMEGEGYPLWAVDLCSAGLGAPHIRQRLWFVAEQLADDDGGRRTPRRQGSATLGQGKGADPDSRAVRLADTDHAQWWSETSRWHNSDGSATGRCQIDHDTGQHRVSGRMADDIDEQRHGHGHERGRRGQPADDRWTELLGHAGGEGSQERPEPAFELGALRFQGTALGEAEPLRGFWRGADWIYCRDGKYRPVEPGSFPLAHGIASRVGLLRGYGNCINAEVAAAFIATWLEHESDRATLPKINDRLTQ